MSWTDTAEINAIYQVELPGGVERLQEAVLYVCSKAIDMERFGRVKLNKILWRADFMAYAERGVPVTGRAYVKLPEGPVPSEMTIVSNRLLRGGHLRTDEIQVGQHTEKRPVALAQPNLKYFSPLDLDFLDGAIKHFWKHTGAAASEESHGIAWKTRELGENLPYQSALFSNATLSSREADKLAGLAKERGWKTQ
ncbi:MAG: Panacea domain-containing protein [Pseudomonadota bacterium]